MEVKTKWKIWSRCTGKVKAFMNKPIFRKQVIFSISRRELAKVDPSRGRSSSWEHFDRLGYILEATNRVYDNPADSKGNTIIAHLCSTLFKNMSCRVLKIRGGQLRYRVLRSKPLFFFKKCLKFVHEVYGRPLIRLKQLPLQIICL